MQKTTPHLWFDTEARQAAEAAAAGLDAFLTGEPKHDLFHEPFERGVNALFAGHYMTETVGVQLLAEHLGGRRAFDRLLDGDDLGVLAVERADLDVWCGVGRGHGPVP